MMQNTGQNRQPSGPIINLASLAGPSGQIVLGGGQTTTIRQVSASNGASRQLMTKVVYSSDNHIQDMDVDSAGLQTQATPTKTITIAPTGGLNSPSPTKRIITATKVMSPLKSPMRAIGSPTKVKSSTIVSGQRLIITNNSGARPQVTGSPQRLIIKPQQSLVKQNATVATPMTSPDLQPLSVSGSKFQYVRLVSASPSSGTVTRTTSFPSSQPKSILPANVKVLQPQVAPKPTTSPQQRVLLPANPGVVQARMQPQQQTPIRPATAAPLPVGTTIIQGSGNAMQSFALVPSHYVNQLQHQKSNQGSSREGPPMNNARGGNSAAAQPPGGSRPRRPCNCTKSMCLKLYCDCFANGEFCHNCNCTNCSNNLEHEEERTRAVKQCLDRNPNAFHPKIGKGANGAGGKHRRHIKGCNCKRSGCLKNYCECYEAKISCSAICKCVGCKNVEDSVHDHKSSAGVSDANDSRTMHSSGSSGGAVKTERNTDDAYLGRGGAPMDVDSRPTYTFFTREVAEATSRCLLAQAEDAERQHALEQDEERAVLEEFGRCLLQMVDSANRRTGDDVSHYHHRNSSHY